MYFYNHGKTAILLSDSISIFRWENMWGNKLDVINAAYKIHAPLMKSAQAIKLRWLQRIWSTKSVISATTVQWSEKLLQSKHLNWIYLHEILAWESYQQDGCHVCWWSTKNRIMWQLQNNVWPCLSAIRVSFSDHHQAAYPSECYVTDDGTWVHPSLQTGNESLVGTVGLLENVHQRKQGQFRRLESSWPLFFGIRKA